MAKPIFIATIASGGIPFKAINDIAKMLEKRLNDYHVIVSFDGNIRESKYQVFSDKEIEPIELDKLKEIVNGSANGK